MSQYLYPINDLWIQRNGYGPIGVSGVQNESSTLPLWSSVNNGIATANDLDYFTMSGAGYGHTIFEMGPVLVQPEDALIGIRALSMSGVTKCKAYLIDKQSLIGSYITNYGKTLGESDGYDIPGLFLVNDSHNIQATSAITEIGEVYISGGSFANYTIYPNVRNYPWDLSNSALALRFTSFHPYNSPPFPQYSVRISELEVQLSGDPICCDEFNLFIPGGVEFDNRENTPSGYTHFESVGEWTGDFSFSPSFDLGFYKMDEGTGTQFFPVSIGPTGVIDSETQWRNAFTNTAGVGNLNYNTLLQFSEINDRIGYLDVQTTGDFTVFFKLNTIQYNSQILSKGTYPSNLEYSFTVNENGYDDTRTLELGAESTSNQYISLQSIVSNESPLFVAATYGPDNKLRLYHNRPYFDNNHIRHDTFELRDTSSAFTRNVTTSSIVLGDGGGIVTGNENTYLSNLGFANYAMAESGLDYVFNNWHKLTSFIDDVPTSSRYIQYIVEDDLTSPDDGLWFHVPVEDYYYQVDNPVDNRNGPFSENIASSSCLVLDMWVSNNTSGSVVANPSVKFRYSPHYWVGHSTVIPSSELSLISITGKMFNEIYHEDNGNYHAVVGREDIDTNGLMGGHYFGSDYIREFTRTFFVQPNFTFSNSNYTDLRIHSVSLRTEAWMLPRTGIIEDDNFPLYISGFPGANDSIDLFIEGGDRSKSCDLFIQSIGNQSGDITLFLEATPQANMPLVLWSQSQGNPSDSFDLFTHGASLASGVYGQFGGFDLFIEGGFNANMPLYISGPSSLDTTSNMPLYIGAVQEGTQAGFDLFLSNNYSTIYSGFPMFIESTHIDSNASMNLFINRAVESTSDAFPMYIPGPSSLYDNFSLFIEGANKLNEDMTLFISGNGTSNNNLSLYSHGF